MRQGDDYLLTNIIDHVANVGRHQREDVVKQSLVASQLGRSDIQILRGPVTCQVDIPEKKKPYGSRRESEHTFVSSSLYHNHSDISCQYVDIVDKRVAHHRTWFCARGKVRTHGLFSLVRDARTPKWCCERLAPVSVFVGRPLHSRRKVSQQCYLVVYHRLTGVRTMVRRQPYSHPWSVRGPSPNPPP